MGIIYILSIITLILSFIFVKKTERELDIVNWIAITFVLLLCYNSFICHLLTVIHISINMISLSIVNLLVTSIFGYCINKKGKQTYVISKTKIILNIFVFVIVLFVSLYRFDFLNSIAYETTDPAIHYVMAFDFYKIDSLLTSHTVFPVLGDSEGSMSLSYVNVGLMFKAISSFISEDHFYKFFTLFDISMLCLSAFVFVNCLFSLFKDKVFKFLPFIFVLALFYVFGFPFNNLMFGFFYLGMTVTVITSIVLIFDEFEEIIDNDILNPFFCLIMFLTNYAIFFGYYLFVPVIYAAEFIYIFIRYLKKYRRIDRSYIIVNSIALFIPFIIGFVFFLLPRETSSEATSATGVFALEGYIYRDLYSNFLLFVPFILYRFILDIKNKNLDFKMIAFIIETVFILGLFIFGMKGKVSSYYYFKNYFVLAPLVYMLFSETLYFIFEKLDISLLYCSLSTILVMLVLCFFHFDERVSTINILYNPSGKLNSYFDIFVHNRIYYRSNKILDKEDFDTLQYYLDNRDYIYKEEDVIATYGSVTSKLWFYSITMDNPNYYNNNTISDFYNSDFTFDVYKKSNRKFFISFSSLDELEINEEMLVGFKILYQNDSSFILERI